LHFTLQKRKVLDVAKEFDNNPRSFALDMVANGLVSADSMLLMALNYMSHDDVRDMLDANELSPRFDEDDEADSDDDSED